MVSMLDPQALSSMHPRTLVMMKLELAELPACKVHVMHSTRHGTQWQVYYGNINV